MTTEVAILNKSAVALAADSAVTITRQTEGDEDAVSKIYVEANKLFELIKGVPIGVMIYNSAEIAGIPWETLIKVYRGNNRLTRFDTVMEYVAHFLSFVEESLPLEVDDEGMELQTHAVIGNVFAMVYGMIRPNLIREPSKLERRKLFDDALDQINDQLNEIELQAWATGIDESEFQQRWGKEVLQAIPPDMDELRLSLALRKKMAAVLLRSLVRLEIQGGIWSGIVISGFGEREMFPAVYHCRIDGVVEGRLVCVASSQDRISAERPAIIRPYAQTGEALMFLQGIDPVVSNAITSFWREWSVGLHANVAEVVKAEVSGATSAELKEVRSLVRGYMNKSWTSFSEFMNEQFHKRRMEPIEASAGFLSKREIADLAENLVELTSLRNRVSLDRQETVGGATDVAVISKGDGFVWVKRKHYFEHDRNPNWGLQQAVANVVSKLDSMSQPRTVPQ